MKETSNQNINQNKKESSVKSSFFFFILLFLVLCVFDQLTKYLPGSIFKNSNFAFSLPVPVVFMYGIYVCVLVAMSVYVFNNFRKFTSLTNFAWVLIFSGALCNIVERIFLGYVRDWIYVFNGVFNLADFYIIAGVLILLLNPKFETNFKT